MKKDDLIILVIGLLLLAGMLFTIFFGGEKTLHGVGLLLEKNSGPADFRPLPAQHHLIQFKDSPG